MRVAGVMVGALVVTLGIQPASASELPGLTASAETAPNWDDDAGGNANADDPRPSGSTPGTPSAASYSAR
jgi:3-phytase